MTDPTTDPDRVHELDIARGRIRTDRAYARVQTMRATFHAWHENDPELVAALAEGDRAWPDDERRYDLSGLGMPDIDVDPDTMAELDRRMTGTNGTGNANGTDRGPSTRDVPAVPVVPPLAGEDGNPTEGGLLLDETAIFLDRFVAFPTTAARTAVVLWVAHCHMASVFESTPRLALLSPEPGSGKTRVLEVVELLVPRPQHVLNASTAAIFRMIEQSRPTLLLDEVDAIFGRNGKGDDSTEDLRALLNAGHRRSATIPRCVGPTHQVQHFPVYAPAALAGLGDLPDTLMTRSVVVRMRRRAPGEHVESFRRRVVEPEGHELRDAVGEWADTVAARCGDAWPEMPPGVVDRPADVWEPLLAVADAAGGHWPATARDACAALVGAAATDDTTSVGVRLLGDIRDVFGTDDRLSTATILERLAELDEAPWGDWYGKPIDARWLARKLKPYGISSVKIRVGETSVRGFHAWAFYDAWARYVPYPRNSGTSGTEGTGQVTGAKDVPPVPAVPSLPGLDDTR